MESCNNLACVSHCDRCERPTQAREPRLECALASQPQRRIESEPRGPSQLRGVHGVARMAPPQLRIAMIRHHGLKVSVLIFLLVCFGFGYHFLASHFRARMDLREEKKAPLESGLNLRDRAKSAAPPVLEFRCDGGILCVRGCHVAWC